MVLPEQAGGGLLARTGSQPVEQQAAPGQEQQAAPGQEQASGEEQDQYDRVVMAGMKVIFENEKTKQKITDRLKADAENPAKTLADTAAMIILQLDEQAGGAIPETVILPAAIEILEHVTEFAESLNMFPIDDAVANHAGQLMVNSLGEQYGVEPEDIQEMMDSVDPEQLKQIEEEQGNFARKQPPTQPGDAFNGQT